MIFDDKNGQNIIQYYTNVHVENDIHFCGDDDIKNFTVRRSDTLFLSLPSSNDTLVSSTPPQVPEGRGSLR